MKLKDIIKLSCVMLNLDDVLNSDLLDDDNFALKTFEEISKNGTNVEQTINLLVKCFNFGAKKIK